MNRYSLSLAFMLAAAAGAQAQSQLYPQHFDLQEVTMDEGPLLTAQNINIKQLLEYDADRLLTPFVRQAGLNTGKYKNWESKHPNFPNWGSGDFRLDGHVGGHYLTALALAYASSHDEAQRTALKERLDYMIEVLKDCQAAYANDTKGMKGFIGGQPCNDQWRDMAAGNIPNFGYSAVPFYCQHKVLAGLRDAYVYGGNETALTLFIGICDWAVNLIAKLTDDQFQGFLGIEHGGMNETLADAYALTGEKKYLDAARRYSHNYMIDGMQGTLTSYNQGFLDGKHANTQVPKYVGFERIVQLGGSDKKMQTAVTNFFDDVSTHRTVCIGGNSVGEHFLSINHAEGYINNLDGPESCNSNNMLKLAESMFDRTHDRQYADFYEATMWNHILSTQDPNTGGYVYFTSLRPQSYRVYSVVNKGMWCCVGTGMENHSKYAHFAYTHDGEQTLYVNLFLPAELDNATFGVKQETQFPFDNKTRLTVTKGGTYTMAVRRPTWAGEGYELKVNGQIVNSEVVNGYVCINRTWQAGDVVDVALPMQVRMEECPGLKQYVAFKYGPILLAATTGTEDIVNEYAGEGRMDHAPGVVASAKTLSSSPLIIGERDKVASAVVLKDASTLTFEMPVRRNGNEQTISLTPFYGIHHARYSCYFWQGTAEEYASSDMGRHDAEEQELIARTLDFVGTGEQQSEAGHSTRSSQSSTGSFRGERYRDAQAGGYFQYELETKGETKAVALMCRYTNNDKGRKCTILVDGKKLTDVEITGKDSGDENGFFNVEFLIPEEMLVGKSAIAVRFNADKGTLMPGLFYLRLVNDWRDRSLYSFKCADWVTGDAGRVAQSAITYDYDNNTISVAATGTNNVCLSLRTQCGYEITSEQKYLVIVGQNLRITSGSSYLWWLNGVNKGSQVEPNTKKNITLADGAKGQLLAWDMSRSGLDGNNTGDRFSICQGNTIFGLTASKSPAIIRSIGFYGSVQEAMDIATAVSAPTVTTSTAVYDLQGRRVERPDHGIYIIGGKKVMY